MRLKLIIFILSIFTFNISNSQINNNMNDSINPLLCDPVEGICEIPSNTAKLDSNEKIKENKKAIRLVYFTDPICSSCWGIEPQLKKLKLEYGDDIEIVYYMGGLLPDWSYNSGGISKPSDVAHHWDEVSAYYKMPIDGDVWLEDPLHSSYPPSIAFKAAQMQDETKAILFLRLLREMVFLKKMNITKWEHISKAANDAGLDTNQLKKDYEGPAIEKFNEDLKYASSLGVRGFPTLLFYGSENTAVKVYGFKPYSQMTDAIKNQNPNIIAKIYPRNLEFLFKKFNSLSLREFAELMDIDLNLAQEKLNEETQKGNLIEFKSKNGSIWYKKF